MAQNIFQVVLNFQQTRLNRQTLTNLAIAVLQYLLFPTLYCLAVWGLTSLFAILTDTSANLIATFCLPLLALFSSIDKVFSFLGQFLCQSLSWSVEVQNTALGCNQPLPIPNSPPSGC